MSEKDSPLGDIREQLEEAETEEEPIEEDDTIPEEEPIPDKDKEVEQVEEEKEDGPWFPFSESLQRPMYPHEDRWEEWEDAKFEVELALREQDIRDVQGREMDDAVLKLACENPGAVAELILEARGIQEDS